MSILNHDPFPKRLALMGGAIMVFVLGVGLGIRLSSSCDQASAQDTTQPAFIHQGDKIIIPEGSPLRSHLVVQPATVKNSPHTVQLPAAVEADPARTVNVLPPVAGKVVKLNVSLGEHITKGQPLAVIDSGDLAQAYADDDKGRDALQHAKSSLERVRGVYEAGGGALKDLEQAKSDYAQAQAEFDRAEARLREIGISSQTTTKSRLLTLTAPMTGTVTALTTASGAFANDLTAPLMTISNLDSVWVTANVPEIDIAFVAKG